MSALESESGKRFLTSLSLWSNPVFKSVSSNQRKRSQVEQWTWLRQCFVNPAPKQIFYTSTVSRFWKFTQKKRVNRDILNLKYYIFGAFTHSIGIISQFSYVYVHYTHYQWVKHGLILPKHRKNCECCHHHSLFKGHNVNVKIVVPNCHMFMFTVHIING